MKKRFKRWIIFLSIISMSTFTYSFFFHEFEFYVMVEYENTLNLPFAENMAVAEKRKEKIIKELEGLGIEEMVVGEEMYEGLDFKGTRFQYKKFKNLNLKEVKFSGEQRQRIVSILFNTTND